MAETKKIKWNSRLIICRHGDQTIGCPYERSADSYSCQGMGAWKINQGRFADLSLDGLSFGFAAHWPKAIHEGNGTVCLFFDERAGTRERRLLAVLPASGGGCRLKSWSRLSPKSWNPGSSRFISTSRAGTAGCKWGDAVSVALEPIKNPVTGEPESVRIEHETGFVFKHAECASSKESRVSVGELNFSWPNRSAFITKIKYGN